MNLWKQVQKTSKFVDFTSAGALQKVSSAAGQFPAQ
jgi:hypothetical protein